MSQLPENRDWVAAVAQLQAQRQDYVLITLLGSRGPTPRDGGTKMVVSASGSYGTIGGGHLELKAMQLAAELLLRAGEHQHIEYFPLGPSLGQCCGGSTSVLFESFRCNQLNIAVFGAGHVGTALVPILQQLPCHIHWVDSREDFQVATAAANVQSICSEEPADFVAAMPAASAFIIMTHNHQQDYAILEAALARGDAQYIGMIGSATKWRRFKLRMEHRGFRPEYYAAVRCPIGVKKVPGKLPVEVAVSVAAEIIALLHEQDRVQPAASGIQARELQPAMNLLNAEQEL